jgi:hypothetical protein
VRALGELEELMQLSHAPPEHFDRFITMLEDPSCRPEAEHVRACQRILQRTDARAARRISGPLGLLRCEQLRECNEVEVRALASSESCALRAAISARSALARGWFSCSRRCENSCLAPYALQLESVPFGSAAISES